MFDFNENSIQLLVNELYIQVKACIMATIGSPKTNESDMDQSAKTVDKHYIDTIMLTLMRSSGNQVGRLF